MREMRPNEGGLLEGWVAYRVKTLLGEGREIEMPRYDCHHEQMALNVACDIRTQLTFQERCIPNKLRCTKVY